MTNRQTPIPLDLVERALGGDAEALEDLWRGLLTLVWKLARIIGHREGVDDDDLDDVVQNAIIAMYCRPPAELLAIRDWTAYLNGVVRNCVVDSYRRENRHRSRVVSLETPVGSSPEALYTLRMILPGDKDALAEVSFRELDAFVEQILGGLPKERARAFRLYLEKYRYQEIAETVGVPENTVATWIHRVKLLLAERLGPAG